ncbi:MAG TPA: CocE/NonD family hydrolase [Thermoanaerobaculia bacterium]|nr:CocE/NonD family hydrolase [Thermoanaerobaculia bacterium]
MSDARRLTTLAAAVLLSATAAAQTPTPAALAGADLVRATYTKYEVRIPMRDGAKLFTAVYVPKEPGSWPILLCRTPYSVAPYGADRYKDALGPSDLFQKEKYIFAYQDVRGRLKSDGDFVNVRPFDPKKGPKDVDEASDTYDTIEWLVRNVKGNSGKVGIWGISYPGFYAAYALLESHPALKAVSPQAPIGDWFLGDDVHHNGAFYLPHAFNFFASFGQEPKGTVPKTWPRFDHGTPDGYRYFLALPPIAEVNAKLFDGKATFFDDLAAHDTYDAFWQARTLLPHLTGVKPAVMTVGGWFDAEDLWGALHVYEAVEKKNPGAVNTLVMGPWSHGGWSRSDGDALGDVRFADRTGVLYREKIEFPFFQHHLKGKGDGKTPEAWVFETGTNVWRALDAWPPKEAARKALFLAPKGALAPEPAAGADLFDEYLSDPARPVPYVAETAIGMTREHMTADQRLAGTRPDVLVYQTEPLAEDLTIAGPIGVTLHVSTTGTDADFVVKLIDVYPDDFPDPSPNPKGVRMGGYQQLVRGEAMRGKFRKSFEKPEPFTPGKVETVSFTMPDAFHTFRTGHRVMVQVQSSWFPLVDRNPQTFTNVFRARPEEYRKATERVYLSKDLPSKIELLVLR